jgi:uroporphyrinogen decarboxylase
MTSRARVAAALRRETPDRVPWCELLVDPFLVTKLLGWGPKNQTFNLEDQQYTADEAKEVSAFLGLDNLAYMLRAPIYAHKHAGEDGRLFYGDGMIRTRNDLKRIRLPDPRDPAFWDPVKRYVDSKENYSAWLITRLGIMPAMLCMGTTAFSLALYDDRALVEEIFDIYLEWTCDIAEGASRVGFDAFVTTDDVAFGSATFFSPKVFRELCLERYRILQQHLDIPWIMHSDGNMHPFMKDILPLDIVAFHPVEKAAMDIRETKQRYGHRLCIIGNVDLNTLGAGTPEEVQAEVEGLLRDIAPGGGYIISSGNSLAGYLRPENVLAMRDAIRRCGVYPIHEPPAEEER